MIGLEVLLQKDDAVLYTSAHSCHPFLKQVIDAITNLLGCHFFIPIQLSTCWLKFAQNWRFLPMCPCVSWWKKLTTNWRLIFCSTSSANLPYERGSCLLLELKVSNLHPSLKAVEGSTPKLLKTQARSISSIPSPFTQHSDVCKSSVGEGWIDWILANMVNDFDRTMPCIVNITGPLAERKSREGGWGVGGRDKVVERDCFGAVRQKLEQVQGGVFSKEDLKSSTLNWRRKQTQGEHMNDEL